MLKQCVICSKFFDAIRKKKTCSLKCSNQLKKDYEDINRTKTIERLRKKRKALKEFNSKTPKIEFDPNFEQNPIICDGCGTEYNFNYIIRKSFNTQAHTSHYNSTADGCGICPVCGLVDEELSVDYSKYDIIGGEELELYLAELRTEKPYQIKKVAKYIDKAKTKIDFVKEAIAVRKDRNYYAKNIGDYTDKQLSEISKNKHILVRTSYFN